MTDDLFRVYFDAEHKDKILQHLQKHGIAHSNPVKPTGSINAGIDAETVRLAIEFIAVSAGFLTSLTAAIRELRDLYSDVKPMIFVEDKNGNEISTEK